VIYFREKFQKAKIAKLNIRKM